MTFQLRPGDGGHYVVRTADGVTVGHIFRLDAPEATDEQWVAKLGPGGSPVLPSREAAFDAAVRYAEEHPDHVYPV